MWGLARKTEWMDTGWLEKGNSGIESQRSKTTENYGKEILSFATTWMNPEDIVKILLITLI